MDRDSEKRNQVLVHGNEKGEVIIHAKSGNGYAHIKVSMERMVVDEVGYARKKQIFAQIAGLAKDLEGFGWRSGQMVRGNIVIKERLEPFNSNDPNRDAKRVGKTNTLFKFEGKTIYKKNVYTSDEDAHDLFRDHDNFEEVNKALGKVSKQLEPSPEDMAKM